MLYMFCKWIYLTLGLGLGSVVGRDFGGLLLLPLGTLADRALKQRHTYSYTACTMIITVQKRCTCVLNGCIQVWGWAWAASLDGTAAAFFSFLSELWPAFSAFVPPAEDEEDAQETLNPKPQTHTLNPIS